MNTQTGQQSRDIPQDADDEISDSDLAGLASSPSSRVGINTGLGLGIAAKVEPRDDTSAQAGFGVPKRSGTPEPWVRRLADDGRTYYYQNKLDGQVQSTLPVSGIGRGNSQPSSHGNIAIIPNLPLDREALPHQTSLQSDSTALQSRGRRATTDCHSVYSDDSDIDPNERDRSVSFSNSQSSLHDLPSDQKLDAPPRYTSNERKISIRLTSAERLAQSLQQAIAPLPPELVTELSDAARRAISTVMARMQSINISRVSEAEDGMDEV